MRKITSEACQALQGGYTYKSGNTYVDRDYNGAMRMILHRSVIARSKDGVLEITNAGWPTATTKERLNGLVGVHIVQKAGEWFLNGEAWDGSWITIKSIHCEDCIKNGDPCHMCN